MNLEICEVYPVQNVFIVLFYNINILWLKTNNLYILYLYRYAFFFKKTIDLLSKIVWDNERKLYKIFI